MLSNLRSQISELRSAQTIALLVFSISRKIILRIIFKWLTPQAEYVKAKKKTGYSLYIGKIEALWNTF